MLKHIQFNRIIFKELLNQLSPEQVLILYGPRQVGKTFLIKQLQKTLTKNNVKTMYLSAEIYSTLKILSTPDLSLLKSYLGDTKVIFIDEAQKIPNIGEVLKILVDYTDYKILVSGSSSLYLSNLTEESLAGRKQTYTLYPLTWQEISTTLNNNYIFDNLQFNLIAGNYPKINLMHINGKSISDIQIYLTELVDSTLYKDLLSLTQIKHPQKIFQLLELLYHNISSTVSLHTLANNLNLDIKTVDRYLDLLSKVFIIFPLRPLFTNPSKEITRSKKYYFFDNGIANVFYGDFTLKRSSTDFGKLWENYVISQLMAFSEYNKLFIRFYFWRQQNNTGKVKEIDFVLKKGDKLFAIEAKYNANKLQKYNKPPTSFTKLYPKAKYAVITPKNFMQIFDEIKIFFTN